MYEPLSRDIMEPIAQTLVDAILTQTGSKTMTLVAGEADHNILADVVLRELRSYMGDGFLEAYIMGNSTYQRERQREAEARDDEAREELEQFPDYVRNDEVRTACGVVLQEDEIGCLCVVCDEALQREVREANALNALSERPSVNAPEATWCSECNCRHTLWGCDNLKCEHCYEAVETLDLASFTSLGEELHTPTDTSV